MFRSLRALVLAIVVWSTASFQVLAQVEEHLGPLAGAVTLGVDGDWEARIQDGWFNLFNTVNSDSVQFYYTGEDPLTAGERDISVTTVLRGDGDTLSFTGLVFDHKENGNFQAISVSQTGDVGLLTYDENGFSLQAIDGAKARLDGSDVLEIRETPTKADLVLNGQVIQTVTSNGGFTPSYGIVAAGLGRFAYNGFTINTTQPEQPFPAPGGGNKQPFPAPGGGTTPQQQPFPAPGGGTTPAPMPQPGGGGTKPAPQPVPGQPTGTPQPASTPQQQASPQDIYVSQVLLGTTFGVFFHEFGHALIGETGLPATGPEEDTADEFSAFIMGAMVTDGTTDPIEKQSAIQIAQHAALFWYYSGLENAQQGGGFDWQDEHSPNLKRFRNMFCVLYGSEPGSYSAIADMTGIEEATRQRCIQDFQQRYNAWNTILATVSRNLGPDIPGVYPADAPGGKINLVFQPSQSPTGQAIKQLIGDSGVMAGILQELEKTFVFPRDLKVEFRDCQDVNAWYSKDDASVTMCYNLIEVVSQLIFDKEGNGANGPIGGTQGQQVPGQPAGQPAPGQPVPANPAPGQPAGGNADAMNYLVGTWLGAFQTQAGNIYVKVVYAADGTYTVSSNTPFGFTQTIGNWTADLRDSSHIVVNTNPTDWAPKQLCDSNGNCQPNNQMPGQDVLQVIDQDTVNVQGVNWRRSL